MRFGFASEFVRVTVCRDIEHEITLAGKAREALARGGVTDVGVIFCGNSVARRRWAANLVELGYEEERDVGVLTPRASKGREFESVVVVAPELQLGSGSQRPDLALQAIYVALSRARRDVDIFTNEECARLLRFPGAEERR